MVHNGHMTCSRHTNRNDLPMMPLALNFPSMDYSTKIDAETWDFIHKTAQYYPPDTIDMSVGRQREIYDKMCRAFFQGYGDGITASDHITGGVTTRHYTVAGTPVRATVMYFHGGGFVVGGLDSHDDICAEICGCTDLNVISVDYRLAPEHHHPAMYNDALAATMHTLANNPGHVLLAGDSAGGNLAAAVAHSLRDEPRILGQVLVYPGLGGNPDKGSYIEHAEAPMLRRDEIIFYKDIRLGGSEPRSDPTYAPLHDTNFAGLPPTVVISAECDPLCDDGRDYRDAIVRAGGKAVSFVEPGLVHGYLRARTTVKRAAVSFERIIAALGALSKSQWPYPE